MRVTKGAVYHHFDSKREVFEAIFSMVSSSGISELTTRMSDDSALGVPASEPAVFVFRYLRWLDLLSNSIARRSGGLGLGTLAQLCPGVYRGTDAKNG